MNHCVPEFEMDDDYSIPSSSAQNRPRKSSAGPEDDIMELLWQDGQVVMQSQNQRSGKKQPRYDAVAPPDQSAPRPNPNPNQHLFMEEDEMASWLHYPLSDAAFDQDFCADLLYPNTTSSAAIDPPARPPDTASFVASAAAGSSKPPMPAPRRAEAVQNFAYFSRHKAAAGPSSSKAATMVESCETPAGKEATTYDLTSSPGCSSASAEPAQNPAAEDRKRKGRERSDDSEDVEFESADAKKQGRGSTSTKRARAAEVHNLSERRRRDRINEKMKALQELIPRCNKSDKASMLDEAIEYLKSLQLQVQMMSMGCSMVPAMMYPGMQQYMPPMGLGLGMGMGMGMEMGMNRPMMHFPNVLPGSAMPPATAAPGHFGPRFPMPPPFPMPPVPAPPDQSRIQGNNQSDTVQSNNPLSMQNPNQPRIHHFADPYQQYFGFQQMQLPPQNQGMAQASTSRGGAENPENDQPG